MIKGDFFLPFTVGTPTTAAQPPFQSQYVFDYVLLTNISDITFEVSHLHALYVHSLCACITVIGVSYCDF